MLILQAHAHHAKQPKAHGLGPRLGQQKSRLACQLRLLHEVDQLVSSLAFLPWLMMCPVQLHLSRMLIKTLFARQSQVEECRPWVSSGQGTTIKCLLRCKIKDGETWFHMHVKPHSWEDPAFTAISRLPQPAAFFCSLILGGHHLQMLSKPGCCLSASECLVFVCVSDFLTQYCISRHSLACLAWGIHDIELILG